MMNSILIFAAGAGTAIISPYLSRDTLIFCAGVAFGAGGGYWFGSKEDMEIANAPELHNEYGADNNDHDEGNVVVDDAIAVDENHNGCSCYGNDRYKVENEVQAVDLDDLNIEYASIEELGKSPRCGHFSSVKKATSFLEHDHDINKFGLFPR